MDKELEERLNKIDSDLERIKNHIGLQGTDMANNFKTLDAVIVKLIKNAIKEIKEG